METVEVEEVVSPFIGTGLTGGDIGHESAPLGPGIPAASPFAEALTTEDEQDRAEQQWLELVDDKEQKIARPKQIYTGDRTLDFVPAAERWK